MNHEGHAQQAAQCICGSMKSLGAQCPVHMTNPANRSAGYQLNDGPYPQAEKALDEEKYKILKDIAVLKEYLLMKFHQGDWHAVMDAAADLRELTIKKDLLK